MGVLCAVLLISVLSFFPSARASYPASMDSNWTGAPPAIDGNITIGEWDNATVIDLIDIPGNMIPARMLAMNDASFLYLSYDVVGDLTPGARDAASFSFDTNSDGVATPGREDQFVLSAVYDGSAHYVYDAMGFWLLEDSPFDPGLPNHTGLAGAMGFGPSPSQPLDHVMYEISIPLALLGVSPGESIGFAGLSEAAPGVVDDEASFLYDTWPTFFIYRPQLEAFGTLFLDTPAGVVDVEVIPSLQRRTSPPSSFVWYRMTVKNEGTSGADIFDINVTSTWNVTMFDAAGTNPLVDNTGSGLNDTGSIPSGGSVDVTAMVEVPPGTGADVALLNFTSTANQSVSAHVELHTEIPDAWFNPPHTDTAVDDDVPANGLYNTLQVNVSLYAVVPGEYIIVGVLFDLTKTTEISFGGVLEQLLAGNNTVALPFPGHEIRSSGIDGPYLVELAAHASYKFIDNDTYVTTPYLNTDFDLPGAVFEPPHSDYGLDTDVPPDGYYNDLVVAVRVNVSEEESYQINAYLSDGSGMVIIDLAWEFPFLPVGISTFNLTFSGTSIRVSGIDGPYMVQMMLYSPRFELLDVDRHTTAAYMHDEFQPPGAKFFPPHFDYAVDEDLPPDGYYDRLVLNVFLNVSVSGWYSVYATLYDSLGVTEIDWDGDSGSFTPGIEMLNITFNGVAIRASGMDGPYIVRMELSDSGMFIGNDTHLTAPYNHTEFDPPGASFSPPHSDYGVDAFPPDGYYDYLVVEVNLTVIEAGVYQVDAMLMDPSGLHIIDWAYASDFLSPGLNTTLELWFYGRYIRDMGIDGPYMVDMELYQSNISVIDRDIYLTSAYSYLEFQPDPAFFQPPHSDHGLDTDMPPDGLYNELIVDVMINVTMAGDFYIGADLWDFSGTAYIDHYFEGLTLPAGLNTVNVSFEGIPIRAYGIDGPYLVELTLWDSGWNHLDSDVHFTSPYLHTDFQMPNASFAPPHSDYGLDTDIPPNGHYDFLIINASVNVSVAGDYGVYIELFDQTGTIPIDWVGNYTWLDVGPQIIEVYFWGRYLYDIGIDGPYLAEMYIQDYNWTMQDRDSYLTSPYLATDFEPREAEFTPPYYDYGLDTDMPPNGYFDDLVVLANITVNFAGNYTLVANLRDLSPSIHLDDYWFTDDLGPGFHSIELHFDGSVIRDMFADGPYRVYMSLYNETFAFIGSDVFITGAYSYTEFEPRAAFFQPPHSDYGLDTDVPPNGLYEYLVIEASVLVVEEGDYEIDALLYTWDGNWIDGVTNRTNLTAGLRSVMLQFDGPEIYGTGYDGSFQVELYLYDAAQELLDMGFINNTAFYVHTEFEPPDTTAPSSYALQVPYLQDEPLMISYYASDPQPTEGLDMISLHYSFSSDNLTFGQWTLYQELSITGTESSGGLFFSCPDGEGFYRLYTIATDLMGNEESPPVTPDVEFQLRTASGIVLTVAPPTLVAGERGAFEVTVVDSSGEPIPVGEALDMILLTSSSTGYFLETGGPSQITTVTISSGESSASFDYSDPRAGSYSINVYCQLGLAATLLDVVPGALDQIIPSPFSTRVEVGQQMQFSPTAYDPFGNKIVGLTLTWSVAGGIGAITSDGLFTAGTTAQQGEVIVTSGMHEGRATVFVTPGPATYVLVMPTVVSLQVDESFQFTATAYDQHDNELEEVTFTWSVDAGIGSIDQGGVFLAGQSVASGQVTAATEGITGSADLSVLPGDPYDMTITPANITLSVDDQQLYEAEVWDVYGNLIPDPDVEWSVHEGCASFENGLLTAGPWAGYGIVTAKSGGATADAELYVTPGPLHHVEVDPPGATVRVGDSVFFMAQGYDEYGNRIGDLSYVWEVTEGSGSIAATTGEHTTFTPDSGGICNVSLTVDNLAFTLTVDAIEEAGERPAEWVTYLPLGLLIGLVVGLLIGMLLQKRLRPEKAPEEEDVLEDEAEDVLEDEDET
ncbi:MAG: hypothetical protein V3V21_09475 [Thermoplasmata archaeon]